MAVQKFRVGRPADSPGNAVLVLKLHGGRFPLKPGDSVERPFNTDTEAAVLEQLRLDGYTVELVVEALPEPAAVSVAPPEVVEASGLTTVDGGGRFDAVGVAVAPADDQGDEPKTAAGRRPRKGE